MKKLEGKHIVLGVTGGIAAYKSVYLLRLLVKEGASVQIIGTENSRNFVGDATWEALSGKMPLFSSWESPDSSKITHITMAQDVDLIIVAPATANIIAKQSSGIADDLLSTVLMAATVPVLFAPAMNTEMYNNPATLRNIEFLMSSPRNHFIDAQTGELACNTSGKGRMAEPENICEKAVYILSEKAEKSLRFLISAGATREFIDPVRFLSNPSTGKMGVAIAKAACMRGHKVHLVIGNSHFDISSLPCGVSEIVSADDMYNEVMKRVGESDVLIMSAAVADYTVEKSRSKLKKSDKNLSLTMKRTRDILHESVENMKKVSVRVGFAAETDNAEKNAQRKLISKKLDMIVLNEVKDEFSPFGSNENKVSFVFKESLEYMEGEKEEIGMSIVKQSEKIFIQKSKKLT